MSNQKDGQQVSQRRGRSGTVDSKKFRVRTGCGATINLGIDDISKDSWKHHHGAALDGNTVNSLSSTIIGDGDDRTIVVKGGKHGAKVAFNKSEFLKMAEDLGPSLGYTMSKSGAGASA